MAPVMFVIVRHSPCLSIKNANSSEESFEPTFRREAKNMSRDCVMSRRIHTKQH